MKFASLLSTAIATTALTGMVTVWDAPLKAINPQFVQASAQGMMSQEPTNQEKISQIAAIKGKPGSADLMRKFYKDLTPIGIQPGGAGMVVNLYSKKANTTLSLCTTFDVVVAVKTGRIAKFQPAEVK